MMFGNINKRVQREIYLILHLVFLTKHCTALISEKVELNPEKYEDVYEEDKLQNNVWMNMFGTYPTANLDNVKNFKQNLTRDQTINTNNDNLKQFSNEEDEIHTEEKSIITEGKSQLGDFQLINGENILKIMEDVPLYQLCLRTVNVRDICLQLIQKIENIHKIPTNIYQFCVSLPSRVEIYRCMQKFQSKDNNFGTFLRKNTLTPIAKKDVNVSDTPKRLPFHAWGGKRFNHVGAEQIQTSRVPFNAWGGKRSEYDPIYNNYEKLCEPCKRSKAKFHSWGGKRSKRRIAT